MFKWIFSNLRTIGLAFAMALAVWISAVSSADPDEVRTYPRQVNIEVVGQDPNLVIVGTLPRQASLVLRAPSSVWNQLIATDGQVRLVADLAGLAAGEHTVDVSVQIRSQPVRVISVTPAELNIVLESVASRTLPIEVVLSGETAIGFQAGLPEYQPAEAVISGPQSAVNAVQRVEAIINITGLRENLQAAIDLVALDEQGQPVAGVIITPQTATVDLPITQRGGYRDIAIKVNVRGNVATGYLLTNISVFPPVVTVYSSNPNLVNELPGFVETDALNLNGAAQNIESRLNLLLPAGVSVIGPQTVIVQVGIAPIESSLSLSNLPVKITGLEQGLTADIAPLEVDIILSGPLTLLDQLRPEDIIITVDLSDLEAGVHQVEPKTELLINDLVVQSINPATIEVTIRPASP